MRFSKIKSADIDLSKPVIFCSVPKCGTHLLATIMRTIFGDQFFDLPNGVSLMSETQLLSLPTLENKIYRGHFWYSKDLENKLKGIPKIILIRDPRDYVISHKHFLDYFKQREDSLDKYVSNLKSNDDKISSIIFGLNFSDAILSPTYQQFVNYGSRWIGNDSMIVRYEDLVSKEKGKIEKSSVETISSILRFIGIDDSKIDLEDAIFEGSDPANSGTFRSGKIGTWKEEFKEQHITQMKLAAPNLVSSLGYTSDENWDQDTESFNSYAKTIRNIPFTFDNIREKYDELIKIKINSQDTAYLINCWASKQLLDQNNTREALPILEKVIQYDANNPFWNYHMAYCLHMLDNQERAIAYYTVALDQGFDEFWVRYNRGSLYYQMGKNDLARTDLVKAMHLNPSHKGSHEILQQMNQN